MIPRNSLSYLRIFIFDEQHILSSEMLVEMIGGVYRPGSALKMPEPCSVIKWWDKPDYTGINGFFPRHAPNDRNYPHEIGFLSGLNSIILNQTMKAL
jgi:hypothetical protein